MREPGELEEGEEATISLNQVGPPAGLGINDQLSPEQQENVRSLAYEFWDMFREEMGEARGSNTRS